MSMVLDAQAEPLVGILSCVLSRSPLVRGVSRRSGALSNCQLFVVHCDFHLQLVLECARQIHTQI